MFGLTGETLARSPSTPTPSATSSRLLTAMVGQPTPGRWPSESRGAVRSAEAPQRPKLARLLHRSPPRAIHGKSREYRTASTPVQRDHRRGATSRANGRPQVIQESFRDYYRTTILSDETDPDKLHDLKGGLDQAQVYSQEEIDDLVQKYLAGEERSTFEPILGQCAERYVELTEDEQVRFKGSAKSFTRLYGFLSQILPYTNAGWEKLSIFLNFLIPKLPAPEEQDLSLGILEAVDMETYRTEKQATVQIALQDEDAEIDPVQGERGGGSAGSPARTPVPHPRRVQQNLGELVQQPRPHHRNYQGHA